MTSRDLRNNIEVIHSLAPAVRATGSYPGATVDLQGEGSAVVVAYFGAYTNGTHTVTLEHSDDNVTFTTASAAELDGAFVAVSSVGGANTTQRVGYRGSKRYVRAVLTVAAGATGAVFAALVVKGHPTLAPV